MKKMRVIPVPPIIVRYFFTLFITLALGHNNCVLPDAHDIWAPTATGAFIGGVTGGAKGAGIGAAVGYGIGSINHASRERHRAAADDCYHEIRFLRNENRELRQDIKILNRDIYKLERTLEKTEKKLKKCQKECSKKNSQITVRKSFSVIK